MKPTQKKVLRAQWIENQLNQLYPSPAIPLDHRDPFTLLVAVLLSAQTTDKQVNRVTPALFALASTPEQMARLTEAEIYEKVKSCGLAPKKAKAIAELSKILCNEYDGEVPRTLAQLEALPGVGHKTASVVLIQAFGQPAFPVDTHIHRLAARWGLSSGANVKKTEEDLKALYPPEVWAKLHLQMIYYGREHCTARGCDGKKCLICEGLRREVWVSKTG